MRNSACHPSGTGPFADPLPDYFEYCDEGCDLFPSCLECPLPRFRYDEQAEGRRTTTSLRDHELIRQRYHEGKSIAELAGSFGVSKRTVQRIIRRSSNEQHPSTPGSGRKPHPASADKPHGHRPPQGIP
ncbi:MAG: helix-turn-helix domain-containing protein [Dehalococcoidia bacterium]|nr:MAG: helix-turn-helix domain-containing protein [Dehalococcoidia bacterium]